MTPLLLQFISESRDLLQDISEQLLKAEKTDDKQTTVTELFRLVHTLKGNTGLFEFPDLTRVLHAAEDLMSETRENPELWSQRLTDLLFEAMDYVSQFCDKIEETDGNPVADTKAATQLEAQLRAQIGVAGAASGSEADKPTTEGESEPKEAVAETKKESTKKPAAKK
ncbi:MAG: Hpt domain-containing protein, partial [Thalassolituus sp.]